MYKPLPSFLEVGPSDIEGRGIFPTRVLHKGFRLGISHVFDVEFPDNLIRTPLGGFINHADNPNCELTREGRLLFVELIKKVDAGEELTLKYGRTRTLFSEVL